MSDRKTTTEPVQTAGAAMTQRDGLREGGGAAGSGAAAVFAHVGGRAEFSATNPRRRCRRTPPAGRAGLEATPASCLTDPDGPLVWVTAVDGTRMGTNFEASNFSQPFLHGHNRVVTVCSAQHLPFGWTLDLSHAAPSMSTLASQLDAQKLVGSRARIHDPGGMYAG